ncbi:MAG: ABC transporter ATP-binding protein [Hyphomicrobiales bacterium]|nr:MAG: ABC transporter ATP-binding protein [Hyphomicrobiales bacterium]
MVDLTLKDIQKSFGQVEVLRGIDLDIKSGEFIVFVGPSGCGKSTLLRLIAGLEDITSGSLSINGKVVNDLPPKDRGIAMVFQSYALYPHMTVFENMAFGLKLAGGGKPEVEKHVHEAAEILQLTPLLERLPKELSGGQRQRVAIGRAIVRKPDIFLFDEPLSNLDAALRVQTRIEIAKLNESMPQTTMIYVTHDQVEAMTLADRIVVLHGGIVEQVGSPMDLYHHPDNMFVARFIGSPSMNLIPCTITGHGDSALVQPAFGSSVSVPIPVSSSVTNESGHLGVRPEHLRIAASGVEGLFSGKVDIVEKLGENQLVHVIASDSHIPIIAKVDGNMNVTRGETVTIEATADDLHLFDNKEQAFKRKA